MFAGGRGTRGELYWLHVEAVAVCPFFLTCIFLVQNADKQLSCKSTFNFFCQPAMAVYSVPMQMLEVTDESPYLINIYYSVVFSCTLIV
jgi:hypothetical protein